MKTYAEHVNPTPLDPLQQRFRVDFRKARAVFTLREPDGCVGWLLQDLDRGWWGLFAMPRSAGDYGECTITEQPIAVIGVEFEV